MIVREPAVVPSRHGVYEGAVLKFVGLELAAPFISDGLVLVEVAYQYPLQATEGQLTQLRPARENNQRNFVNKNPDRGVLSPFDRFVGKMVYGEPTHVAGR